LTAAHPAPSRSIPPATTARFCRQRGVESSPLKGKPSACANKSPKSGQ
jgi:hypothetical protein